MESLKIKLHFENMPEPKKNYEEDIGLDLCIMAVEKIRPSVFLLDTGISIQPPAGYYAELHCRSSIFKTDFIMLNNVGIIDPGYRGKIWMPVKYLGERAPEKEAEELIGKRFAQLILKKANAFGVEIVHELNDSQRGNLGLGSSGKNPF